MKIGCSLLPYNIGIEVRDTTLERDVFMSVKGLEKNKSLPAVGVRNGLKVPKLIRPGVSSDRLVISIYLGEYNVDGSNAINNDHVFDAVVSGDDIPSLIPADSDIDITIKVDRSQSLILEVMFHAIGESIEKKIDIEQRSAITVEDLLVRLDEAKSEISALESSDTIPTNEINDIKKMMDDIDYRFDGEKSSDDGKTHLLADLRKAFLKIEKVEKEHEWESLDAELRAEFRRLEKADNELGNKYDKVVEELRKQTDSAIRSKDAKIARAILKDIHSAFVQVTFIYQLIGFIRSHLNNFSNYNWIDANRARQLLNEGTELISNNPTIEKLHPICKAVISLMDVPENEKPKM